MTHRSVVDPDSQRNQHRPTDPEVLRREALRLLRNGLSAADVAMALRVPEIVVRDWMGEP